MTNKEYQRQWVAQRKADGICLRCPAKTSGKTLCADCLEDHCNLESAKRSRQILEGRITKQRKQLPVNR